MCVQVRSKLSTFSGFGVPAEVTCGGNALKFYASVRLNTKRIGLVKKSEEVKHCANYFSNLCSVMLCLFTPDTKTLNVEFREYIILCFVTALFL